MSKFLKVTNRRTAQIRRVIPRMRQALGDGHTTRQECYAVGPVRKIGKRNNRLTSDARDIPQYTFDVFHHLQRRQAQDRIKSVIGKHR